MRHSLVPALGIALALAAPRNLHAQPAAPATGSDPTATARAAIVDEMVTLTALAVQRGVPGDHVFQVGFGAGGEGLVAAYIAVPRAKFKAFQALLDARMDKQVGSTPTTQGSTSLAMKGLVPEILGLAVENGAIQKDVSGTTVTFRAKPMGIVKALQGKGVLDAYIDYTRYPTAAFASRFSGSVGFDTARGSTPGTLTADASQLSAWSIRAEVVNGRNPASDQYAGLWKRFGANLQSYPAAAAALNDALNGWKAFADWQKDLLDTIQAQVDTPFATNRNVDTAMGAFKKVLADKLPRLDALGDPPATVGAALDQYFSQLVVIQKQIDDIYAFANKGTLVTVDWSTARAHAVPDLYTVTGIVQTALGQARKTAFTLNVAASFYRSRPEMASQAFRSFDMTAQLEHPLGTSFVLPSATASLSARYSYLPNDTVAPTTATTTTVASAATTSAVAPKGSIGYFQARLTIPVTSTGVKIPLSITASNRTELIKEKDVRASFGITFDFDTFLNVLTANAKMK